MKHAIPPAATGVAIDVPETEIVLLPFTVVVAVPLAEASGFMKPAELGPYDENPEETPTESTLPMLKTFELSAGVVIKCQDCSPEFPAAKSTKIPLLTAISAPREMNDVLPFMWA